MYLCLSCMKADNIRLGKPSASDDEVIAAAERAQCSEFLLKLEKGIRTMAGDGGKQLSGGERQRISLARAILKDAPIIVLDEATAFMDPETNWQPPAMPHFSNAAAKISQL